MGHSGIYCYQVSRRNGLQFSAPNPGSIRLTIRVRFWSMTVHRDECRTSLLDNHHVIEVRVDFSAALVVRTEICTL